MTASKQETVVVIGATGRLGPVVVESLARRGMRVLRAGRGRDATVEISGVDVTNSTWHHPEAWIAALRRAGCDPARVTGAVNLVAAKRASTSDAQAVGVGSVNALAALPARPRSVHVGSVAEYRAGHPSAYAAGKRAARATARQHGISVVLTVGVVPRPPGDSTDAVIRWLTARLPDISKLRLDTSTAAEVGDAVAEALTISWQDTGHPPPVEITLSGGSRTLAEIFSVRPTPRPYSRVLTRIAANLPPGFGAQVTRIRGFARAGRDKTQISHYDTRPPVGATRLSAGSAGWYLAESSSGPTTLFLVPSQHIKEIADT